MTNTYIVILICNLGLDASPYYKGRRSAATQISCCRYELCSFLLHFQAEIENGIGSCLLLLLLFSSSSSKARKQQHEELRKLCQTRHQNG